MSRVYVFGDEAGDFTFKRKQGASLKFIVGTATMTDCSIESKLADLRRDLAWRGVVLECFHCTEDKQWVRDLVFDLIAQADVRVDATILDKPRARPYLMNDPIGFYKLAMYLHMKYVIPRVAQSGDELMVVASSLQIKKKRRQVAEAVEDVVNQVSPGVKRVTAFHAATSDPCLQVADYVTWAIQRKHERGDDRSYRLIEHLVASEFKPWYEAERY